MRPDDGAAARAHPALFLDRDGVINVDHGYTFRPETLEFTPTAIEGILLANQAGYLVIVVTNQSGIARGLYGVAEMEGFHQAIQARLRQAGARIDAFYHCAFHPDGQVAAFRGDHEDRKPRPGMLVRALRDHAIERSGSFMIGDRQSDLDAAAAVGIPAWLIEANTGDLAAAVRAGLAAVQAPLASGHAFL